MGKKDAAGDVIRQLATKVSGDQRIQKVIAKNIGNMDPALAARVKAGEPAAMLEAYQAIVAGGGRLPARQMELTLPEDPGTAMIPFGTRGPGVPVGGPTGPGVRGELSGPGVRGGQMIPSRGGELSTATERGLSESYEPDVNQMGISDGSWIDERPLGLRVHRIGDGVLRGDASSPSSGRRYPRGSSAGGRPINAGRGRGALLAAGAAGLGGVGIYSMMDGDPDASHASGDITDTSGTAELASESSPPPLVNGPPDYSFQARQLIEELNAMRRAAGGEVPEAKAMMAEINRLLAMSNKQKNAPGYQPAMPTDYHGEAQRLLQKLNADRMEAGGEVPHTQEVMAEVRRLQALGDQQRNARR